MVNNKREEGWGRDDERREDETNGMRTVAMVSNINNRYGADRTEQQRRGGGWGEGFRAAVVESYSPDNQPPTHARARARTDLGKDFVADVLVEAEELDVGVGHDRGGPLKREEKRDLTKVVALR